MRIVIMVEGKTERAFIPYLRAFLRARLHANMPKLIGHPFDGRLPKREALRRRVEMLLNENRDPADAVVALTDVYTGDDDFTNADDAKAKMRAWVGDNPSFHPHAAQYDFEAWLLPYWDDITRRVGGNRSRPGDNPEAVNHDNPPSRRLRELYRTGAKKRHYVKEREARAILEGKDLMVAIAACSELKAFVNTLLALSGGMPVA